jgi:2-methylcitrate dehydratase
MSENARSKPDAVLMDMADYVVDFEITNPEPYRIARYCVLDAIGCALEALHYPECARLVGPPVPGVTCANGARVPGTRLELDPVSAAFSLGTMIRWLDFNDAFTAADGGHPSDNLGGILAAADYVSRRAAAAGKPPLAMRDVLTATIKAYEIVGMFNMENSFTRIGCDHAVLTRVATAAVVTQIFGGSRDEVVNAISNAWADGLTLKCYRQAPNTGTRKNWAAGDETSRGVTLALLALKGEMGYPTVLTAKKFGFYEALFRGQPFKFQRRYGHYVVERVLFKFVAAGMHAQTAVECAIELHPHIKDRLGSIDSITLSTQQALIGIMHKEGPLHNAADRDHCAQYVIAVALIHGRVTADDFDDDFAADPRIDALRAKIKVVENPQYTLDMVDPQKRSSPNAIRITFSDGSQALEAEAEYPLGHSRRRTQALPMLEQKFRTSIAKSFPPQRQKAIVEACFDQERFEGTPVPEFMQLFVA